MSIIVSETLESLSLPPPRKNTITLPVPKTKITNYPRPFGLVFMMPSLVLQPSAV